MKAGLLRTGKENQVQTDCWTVCDAKSALAHVTSTTALRECSDGVCAGDTCGCRIVSAVASGGTVEKMAKRNGGGAAGGEEGVRSRGTSNIVQSDETARCVCLFSMALIAAIWRGSCMRARLGTVMSCKIRMSRRLPQGAPESPVLFTMIMELVLRDLIKSWVSRKLVRSLDDFTLSAICCADDVVLVAASNAAAEVMVSEIIAKVREVGLTVGHPKMPDKSIVVRTAVL